MSPTGDNAPNNVYSSNSVSFVDLRTMLKSQSIILDYLKAALYVPYTHSGPRRDIAILRRVVIVALPLESTERCEWFYNFVKSACPSIQAIVKGNLDARPCEIAETHAARIQCLDEMCPAFVDWFADEAVAFSGVFDFIVTSPHEMIAAAKQIVHSSRVFREWPSWIRTAFVLELPTAPSFHSLQYRDKVVRPDHPTLSVYPILVRATFVLELGDGDWIVPAHRAVETTGCVGCVVIQSLSVDHSTVHRLDRCNGSCGNI